MEFFLAMFISVILIAIPMTIIKESMILIFRVSQLIYKTIVSRNEQAKKLKMEEERKKYWDKSQNIYEVIENNIIKKTTINQELNRNL